jgi:membrane-bound inhibitor of C-type lysozyme
VRQSRKSQTLAAVTALITLAACSSSDEGSQPTQSTLITPPMMNTRPAAFFCEENGNIVIRPVGEDGKTITLATRRSDIRLRLMPSDQGRKYSDGETVFWMNGENARLLVAGSDKTDKCEQR